MVPAKLKRRLETNHPSLKTSFFARLLESNKRKWIMRRATIVSEKALKLLNCVAELVAKSKQPHAAAEILNYQFVTLL